MDGVEPEAGHTSPVPPLGGAVHRADHGGIAPIQVGLLRVEVVVVVLFCFCVPLPRGAAKYREPIVRRIGSLSIAPDVPVALIRSARRSRIEEPGMLVGGMVHHEIENDLD